MEFETNAALVLWLQDQGLSPFTLLKLSPKPTAKPKKLPTSVTMEWGLEDLEHEGDREKFLAWRVTAEDLEVFRSEGELDRFEECHTELGSREKGIDLRFEAGGALSLRCARLVVVDEPVERFRKGQPRPHHGEFSLELELETLTWQELREQLEIPNELSCIRHLKLTPVGSGVRAAAEPHVVMVDREGHEQVWLSVNGRRVTVSRGKWATDELWEHIWSQGRLVPGVTLMASRDLVCAPTDWPEQPPRKPLPQVWPNVFGVACQFESLTLDELRDCLGIPRSSPFAFEDEDAAEPRATLTLGEAARHGGAQEVTGIFQTADGKPLVQCRADLHEGVLSLHRQPGCPDSAWLAIWSAPQRLPGVTECHSRTTQSPPDPWPSEPPQR